MRFIDFMPDVAFLRVVPEDAAQAQAYTLIRNKAHSNVAFMFDEEERRERDDDTLTVYRGLLGSYPNFFFDVPLAQLTTSPMPCMAPAPSRSIATLSRATASRAWTPPSGRTSSGIVDYMQQTQPLAGRGVRPEPLQESE